MAEEIAFENGRISKFEELMALTLTSDGVILHTVVHHSSTYACMPIFLVDGQTYNMDGHF